MLFGLIITISLWLVVNNPRWAVPIRVGPFLESIMLTFKHADNFWLIRTLTVLGLMVCGLGSANFWCRYACPTGGVLEIFKCFSLFGIYKTGDCNNCNNCLKNCEMGTRPAETNCTNCGDCINLCPMDAIKIGRRMGRKEPYEIKTGE